jgi:hypothetical protein
MSLRAEGGLVLAILATLGDANPRWQSMQREA